MAAGTAQISTPAKRPTDAPPRSSRRSSNRMDGRRASGSPPGPAEPPEPDPPVADEPGPPAAAEPADGSAVAEADEVGAPSDGPGPAGDDDVGAAVAPGEPRGDPLGEALPDGSGLLGSGSDGIGSDWTGEVGIGSDGVGSGTIGLGVGVGGGVGTGVGAGVGGGVGAGDGVTAGPATTTIGGTPRSAPLPLHPWSRYALEAQARLAALSAVALTVKRTHCNNASRSPPLPAWTLTVLPTLLAPHEPPAFDPVTPTLAMLKFAGTVTITQPISLLLWRAASGSSFVAVSVKVVATPVVATSGDATSVQRTDSALVDPGAPRASTAAKTSPPATPVRLGRGIRRPSCAVSRCAETPRPAAGRRPRSRSR